MAAFHPQRAARWGWFLLIWGAPWSHAAMSAGTAWVGVCAALSWMQGRRVQTTPSKNGLGSPWFWLVALFSWQIVTLAWSENLDHGMHILSIQLALPVLAWAWLQVPLFAPQTARTWVFRSAALALAGVLIWGVVQTLQGTNLAPRDWTPWMSHIRLSMFAALAWAWGLAEQPRTQAMGFGMLWLAFAAVTGSFTSVLFLPLALIWGLSASATPQVRRRWHMGGMALGVAVCFAAAAWLQPVPLPFPANDLPKTTSLGNRYEHQPDRVLSEGGHRIYLYICEEEWPEAWAQVSNRPLTQAGEKGFCNRDRLLRYLTSKGWPKDAEHILQLTPEDVNAIENGATHAEQAYGIAQRMRETRREWEMWRDGGSASGHALFQRFEHWNAGLQAFSLSPWFGHGAGDTGAAISASYDVLGTPLASQHRHRAHMQHLTWAISGGAIALLLWMAFLHGWWQKLGASSRFARWGGVVVLLSCCFEDTWETQAGMVVSFLALFAATTSPNQAEYPPPEHAS